MSAINIGYSPCPNDTFIFDALANGKIELENLTFEPHLADVEALNKWALTGKLAVTKISFSAYMQVQEQYILLNAGAALGQNCGPLVVCRPDFEPKDMATARIAIPGEMTTANFLFSLKYPQAKQKTAFLFSDIEDAVLDGRADVGLIIHENRFTYAERGLVLLADLGAFWQDTTGSPIPLGGIAARRDLPLATLQAIDNAVKRSVEFAQMQPASSFDYVCQHAQTMSPEVMRQHIALYVNDFSRDLGAQGRQAVELLFQKAKDLGLIKNIQPMLFVPQI